MRGIEIMLMGIYSAMQNATDYIDKTPIDVDGSGDLSNFNASLAEWYSRDRHNPMPSEIKISSWQNMPYSGFKKNAKGEYEGMGYAFELLKLMQTRLNFTYTIVPPKTPILGDQSKGVMQQLHNKEVDMVVAFIPVLPSLLRFCWFSTILDEAEITFLMKRPRESAIGSGLLAPFNTTVWFCILAALIVVGPVTYVLLYIRKRISSRGNPEGYPLSTCIWFTYGALLKQGSTVTPVTDSARLLFATWWIFITILTSFYTANLTAFLTLSEFTLPFTSIMDITRENQKWVAFQDHDVEVALNVTYGMELELLKKSLTRKEGRFIASKNSDDKKEDFRIVRNVVNGQLGELFLGDRLFIEDLIFNDYRTKTLQREEESKRCTLVMQPENLYVTNRAFAFPKNSTIVDHINKELRNLVETGIVKHLKDEALPSVQYCPLNLKSTERRLRNTDLKMTYYCVCVGFALATVAFFGELIYRLMQLRKSGKRGNCCETLCWRSKMKSAVLPVYKRDSRPNLFKPKPSPSIGSPYSNLTAEQHVINGRDYWVVKEHDGDRRLVPIRSPSALIYQYASFLEPLSSRSHIPKF